MANGDGSPAPPMSESLGMPAGLAGMPASVTSGPTPMPSPRVPTDVQSQNAPLPQQYDPSTQQPLSPHHGALAGALIALAGPDISHKVDPATGQMTTVATPPTPGSAFRKILAGALTGMGAGAAAGASGHPGAGILGGIGAGGTAEMNRQQALNQQDIQNKQTEFENQQKAKLQEATLALHNAELLNQRRNMDRMDAEDFLKVQASNEKFADLVTQKGGELMPIVVGGQDINGKPGNWEQMRAYFTNPDNVKPPEGYHLVYNTTYDTSGLHRQGNQWVDRDGNQVDLNSRASEMVALYPNAKLNETFNMTPDEFEKTSGVKPPASMGKTIPVTMDQLIGMHAKKVAGDNQAMRISVSGGGAGDKRNDRSYQFNSTQLEKEALPIEQRAQRLSTLVDTLNQNSPQADALIAPELLTTIAGGQGSGVRMNEAEISRIVGGANKWQQLKSKVLAWQADPSKPFQLLPEQRGEVRALLTTVQSKIQQKAAALQAARQQLVDAESPTEHRQILTNMHKQLDDIDSGKAGTGGAAPPASLHINPQTKEQIYWDGKAWVPWTGQQTTPP